MDAEGMPHHGWCPGAVPVSPSDLNGALGHGLTHRPDGDINQICKPMQ